MYPVKSPTYHAALILVFMFLFTGLIWLMKPVSMKDHWQLGYEQGRKDALKTNPVSEDLELTCASLWVGKQIRKQEPQ